MRVDAGTVKLNVVDTGAGEPALVFLHYWGGAARTWHQVTRKLEHSYRCVAYDQRGWGTSDAPETGYELDDLAGDLSALITHMDLRRYVFVGHSMGGKVAMLAASRRPSGWSRSSWWRRRPHSARAFGRGQAGTAACLR